MRTTLERGILDERDKPLFNASFRDCRKSPSVAILENSHIVKSTTYVSEKTRFKVFRLSLLEA